MRTIKDKGLLILSTLMCLLPIGMYLLVFDRLPEQMVQQWGAGGTPNWTMQRELAIFVTPLLLAAVHIIVFFVMNSDQTKTSTPLKMRTLFTWFIPVTSVFINLMILLANLNEDFNISTAVFVFVGLTFIIVGNYLPTTRQNYYVGMRLPWTLKDADNWSRTHRLSGKIFVVMGIAFVLVAALPLSENAMIAFLVVSIAFIVLVPSIYSYLIYRNK